MERLSMFLVFSALFLAASADQLLVLKTPKSIELKGESYLTPETVEDVLSAALGYSVPHDETSTWDGLVINDPFNLADGVVSVVVEGIDSLSLKDARTFDVLGSGDPLTGVVRNVEGHQGTKIDLDLKTDVTEALKATGITPAAIRSTEYLKPKAVKADADFLKQISIIDGLTEFIKSNRVPTATVVRASLSAVLKEHEPGTDANIEAFKVLRNAITALTEAANKAHNGNALISILATADTVHRAKREVDPTAAASDLNIVDGFDSDYPVIFNIILWFTIVMLLTLLAISMAIGGMDPGRDSIIYRMTSTRMKKDN